MFEYESEKIIGENSEFYDLMSISHTCNNIDKFTCDWIIKAKLKKVKYQIFKWMFEHCCHNHHKSCPFFVISLKFNKNTQEE